MKLKRLKVGTVFTRDIDKTLWRRDPGRFVWNKQKWLRCSRITKRGKVLSSDGLLPECPVEKQINVNA
jgi:hypothetical protein